jgi:hypothetical protein
MLRKVMNFDYVGACRYTGYNARSVRLTLECGHTTTRKASDGVPMRAKCRDCEHLASGGETYIDGVKQLPWCPFCKKNHDGGDTCMGHHP